MPICTYAWMYVRHVGLALQELTGVLSLEGELMNSDARLTATGQEGAFDVKLLMPGPHVKYSFFGMSSGMFVPNYLVKGH